MRLIQLQLGDCIEQMKALPESCVGAIITDPPYGLEFMGNDWDAPWKTGAGFSKPGIGDRETAWPSFGGAQFGGTNPTCSTCGGRARGKKKCHCTEPDWKVCGKAPESPQVQKQLFQKWATLWLKECYRILQPGGLIKVFGAPRMYHRMGAAMSAAEFKTERFEAWVYGSGFPKSLNISKALAKVTVETHEVSSLKELAQKYEGYGTSLKPGWEPFLVGRKQ